MKTNQEYKNASLAVLRGNWSPAVLVTVVFFAVILVCNVPSFVPQKSLGGNALMALGGGSFLLSFFILLPLEFGYYNSLRAYFDQGNNDTCANMFSYATGNYLHVVWTIFLMGVKIFLWTLLFIIPGIIKIFAYAMTPFVLADHPELSASEAIAESERLMKGHKFDLFFLELSFIGWIILCVFTLGIGAFWLEPYIMGAVVGFYNDIKEEKAL